MNKEYIQGLNSEPKGGYAYLDGLGVNKIFSMSDTRDRISKVLLNADVNSKIHLEGLDIRVEKSQKACKGCIFETENKSYKCNFKNACMAHLRKDKESVVFANGTTE